MGGNEALRAAHMFTGETVVIHFREEAGKDALGNVIYNDVPTEISDVLVSPMSYYDAFDTNRPQGETGDYTLHFPKTFNKDLTHLTIDVRGIPCHVIGTPIPYIEENTPGAWWLKVDVEVING